MAVARLPSTPPPLPTLTHHPTHSHHSPPLLLLRRPRPPRPRRLVADPPNPIPTTTAGDTSDVLRLMDALNLPVSDDTYAALLKESAAYPAAAAVLRHMVAAGRRPGTHLANRLLVAFVGAASMELAGEVFDGMPERDSVSWAAMIFGLVATSDHRNAMRLLARMMVGECRPTAMILVAAIRACIGAKNLGYGEQVHGLALKHGLTRDLFLASTLVHFYGKLNLSRSARRVFDEMRSRNAVTWTALIGGCTNAGEFGEALGLFKEMGRVGKKKNEYTFSSVLGACGEVGDGGFHGRQVHAEAIKLGVEFDPIVQSSLFGMYTRLGLVDDATMMLRLIAMEGSLGFEAVKSFCLR